MTGAARTDGEEELAYALAALDVMTDAFIVVAPDLSVLVCNVACAQALGGRPASIAAAALAAAGTEVLHLDGDVWPQEDWAITRAVRDGVTTTGQLMDLRRDGAVVRVSVSAAPLHRPGEDRPYAAFAVYGDATQAQTAALALAESEAHFRLLAENSTDVITRHSADGTCLYASPALLDLVGRDPATLTGRRVPDFVHPEDLPALTEATIRLFRAGEISVVRYRTAHVDGRWVWVETVMRPVRADDRVLELQSSTRDITARVEAEQRLARLALSDPLTGLSNRAALQQHLEDLLAGDQPLSLLFLDLDRFKLVNDSLGHSAGDELLRTVAARLSGTCRDGDLVARLGGDEFVMVAAGLDETGALLLAERVQHVLGMPVDVAGHELVVTVSVGIVTSGRGSRRDAEALLRDADVSMYEAKAGGRARAVLWSASTGQSAVARLTLERELRAAIAGGQLVVHHQPQVELVGRRVVGVEALVRWQHPTRGLLPPAAFLEVAEDTGLIVELGRQVLRSAAAQVAAWRRLPGCEDLTL